MDYFENNGMPFEEYCEKLTNIFRSRTDITGQKSTYNILSANEYFQRLKAEQPENALVERLAKRVESLSAMYINLDTMNNRNLSEEERKAAARSFVTNFTGGAFEYNIRDEFGDGFSSDLTAWLSQTGYADFDRGEVKFIFNAVHASLEANELVEQMAIIAQAKKEEDKIRAFRTEANQYQTEYSGLVNEMVAQKLTPEKLENDLLLVRSALKKAEADVTEIDNDAYRDELARKHEQNKRDLENLRIKAKEIKEKHDRITVETEAVKSHVVSLQDTAKNTFDRYDYEIRRNEERIREEEKKAAEHDTYKARLKELETEKNKATAALDKILDEEGIKDEFRRYETDKPSMENCMNSLRLLTKLQEEDELGTVRPALMNTGILSGQRGEATENHQRIADTYLELKKLILTEFKEDRKTHEAFFNKLETNPVTGAMFVKNLTEQYSGLLNTRLAERSMDLQAITDKVGFMQETYPDEIENERKAKANYQSYADRGEQIKGFDSKQSKQTVKECEANIASLKAERQETIDEYVRIFGGDENSGITTYQELMTMGANRLSELQEAESSYSRGDRTQELIQLCQEKQEEIDETSKESYNEMLQQRKETAQRVRDRENQLNGLKTKFDRLHTKQKALGNKEGELKETCKEAIRKVSFYGIKNRIQVIAAHIDDTKKTSHKNSDQYGHLLETLEETVNILDSGNVKADKLAALKKLRDKAKEYLDAKKEQTRWFPSKMRKTRIAYAKSLMEFSDNCFNLYGEKLEQNPDYTAVVTQAESRREFDNEMSRDEFGRKFTEKVNALTAQPNRAREQVNPVRAPEERSINHGAV